MHLYYEQFEILGNIINNNILNKSNDIFGLFNAVSHLEYFLVYPNLVE